MMTVFLSSSLFGTFGRAAQLTNQGNMYSIHYIIIAQVMMLFISAQDFSNKEQKKKENISD